MNKSPNFAIINAMNILYMSQHFAFQNDDEMRRAILTLAADPGLCRKMSEASRLLKKLRAVKRQTNTNIYFRM